MKKIISLNLILLLIFALVSCSSGADDLIGTWKMEDDLGTGIEIVMTFTEDEVNMMGMIFGYKVSGNKLSINISGEEETAEFEVKGDKLIMSFEGEEVTYIRVE